MESISPSTSRLLEAVLSKYGRSPHALLQILREIQESLHFVPQAVAGALAEGLGLPISRVESTLSFYSFLYPRHPGHYRVLFSDNITDQMAGSRQLAELFGRHFQLLPGTVSPDGLLSYDFTSCTGMGDQGPALLVNNWAIPGLSSDRIKAICDLIQQQIPLAKWPADYFRVADNIRIPGVLLGYQWQPGEALKAAIARGPEAMLEQVKRARLRGRGGAGYSTASKWEACRRAPGQEHYIVCNADEGEPGTFKDRVLLQSFAGAVFEGMLIAAWVVGARKALLYLRGEYRYLLAPLQTMLDKLRNLGLLGMNIGGQPGFDVEIEIHLGAGAYICGEESALIESLEGKPGRPRIRPPYPTTCGYLGQPTAVNNVETLAAVTQIALLGGDWYGAMGTAESSGSKILSVSGDCQRPGLYEYPFGVTLAQVLADCGADNAQAVQVSGAAGVCLGRSEFARCIAYEDVATAGSFMVFGPHRDMFEMARNFSHFFAHESCGFCTPCRVGTSLLRDVMDKIGSGRGTASDLAELRSLKHLLQTGSHCGLGQTAGNAVGDSLEKFPLCYENRLLHQDYSPAFDLDAALAPARTFSGRDDQGAHLGEKHGKA